MFLKRGSVFFPDGRTADPRSQPETPGACCGASGSCIAPTADASELKAGQVQDKAPIKSEDTSAYMVTTPPQSNKGGRKKK